MALGLPGPSRVLSLLKTLSLIPQSQWLCEIAYLRDQDENASGGCSSASTPGTGRRPGQAGNFSRLKKEPHPHPQAWETQLMEQPEKTLGCREAREGSVRGRNPVSAVNRFTS